MSVTTTITTATLTWTPPVSDGGRDDVFYIVKYKTTMEQQFTYYSPSSPITDNFVIVTSLASLTTYMFMVVAENGVTQEFSEYFLESNRTSSAIFATTQEGGEHMVKCSFAHALVPTIVYFHRGLHEIVLKHVVPSITCL